MDIVDLHIHTEFSDGKIKISELESFAKEVGIKCLSITDHDTIEGYINFINYRHSEQSFQLISGIEVTAHYGEKEVHLLGYNMDINSEAFKKLINKIKMSFAMQTSNVIKLLRQEGYDLEKEDMWLKKGIVALASFCVKKGDFSDERAFYRHIFYRDGKRVNKRKKPDARYVIKSIINAGGFVSLAHPSRISDDISEVECVIKELKEYGLNSLECFHPLQKENYQIYKVLAAKYDLNVTGGSDFHENSIIIYKQDKLLIQYTDKLCEWDTTNNYIYV